MPISIHSPRSMTRPVTCACSDCNKTFDLMPHQPNYSVAVAVTAEQLRVPVIPCGCKAAIEEQFEARKGVGLSKNKNAKRNQFKAKQLITA